MGLSVPGKVKFEGLCADAFRHPLDLAQTSLVQNIPFSSPVERIIRERLLPVVEEAMELDNLANSVQVGPTQLPQLHQLLVEAAEVLDIKAPALYVKQNPQPNAYTMAVNGDKPVVVVHSSLLALCDDAETQAILAHELGHLKCEHGIWLSLGNLAGTGAAGIPLIGDALDAVIQNQLQEWQRAAEFSCDRAALLVAQDPKVVVSALLKLVGGSIGFDGGTTGTTTGKLDVEAFLAQAEQYNAALKKARPVVRASMGLANAPRSHPLPVTRVAELDRWARGAEYSGMVKRAKQRQIVSQDRIQEE